MSCCEYGAGRPGITDHLPGCWQKKVDALEAENATLRQKIDRLESCEVNYIEDIQTLHERIEAANIGGGK